MKDLRGQTGYMLCAVGSYLKTEKPIKNLLEQRRVRQECGVTVSRSQTETLKSLKSRRSARLQRADVACSRASVPSFKKKKNKTDTFMGKIEKTQGGGTERCGERGGGAVRTSKA